MADKKILDISDLDTSAASNAGAEIELLHDAHKTKTGLFITILGKDSDAFQEHKRHRINENIRKNASATRKGNDPELPTAEESEEKTIELLTLCTVSWRQEFFEGKEKKDKPTLTYRGEELACNVPNITKLYREQLWIRRQVDEAIGDLEHFMKA